MTASTLADYSTRVTPQGRAADPRQRPNNAGGYTFVASDEARLRRFLVLGANSGTFHVSARDAVVNNGDLVVSMACEDHALVLATILDVSLTGAAPKQNPTMFAYAVACSIGTETERGAALDAMPQIIRTGSHMLLFARYIENFRGWGRALRRAVGDWYAQKSADDLAYQAIKYRQRDGFAQRDMLRLAHPKATSPGHRAVYDFLCGRQTVQDARPALLDAFIEVQADPSKAATLIRESALSWEMLPDAALTQAQTWDALLDRGMPLGALIRQLPRLTMLGLLPAMGGRTTDVVAAITDAERLRKARVHPMNVLVAQRTYASGHSLRGEARWTPNRKIADALDAAFYASFGSVAPTGKRTMLALDVSASMTWGTIAGLPITPREASAAMALVTAAVEPDVQIMGFGEKFVHVPISPRQRLDDSIKAIEAIRMGGTDCSVPMTFAQRKSIDVDTFVVYTDNETWAGAVHPHQALTAYRQSRGIDAKMAVVGMTATQCSIADPSDPGMLDIAGFDVSTPAVVSAFSAGV